MRAVDSGRTVADDAFTRVMDECVQCRACETACPSEVPFGRLMEGARATLASESHYQPWWKRLAYWTLGRHRLLIVLSTLIALAQRLGLVPRRLGVPRLPLSRPRLVATGTDVWLFTGCVMDAWMRPTHVAVQRVIGSAGAGMAFPGPGGDCCGALHVHAGLLDQARRHAARVIASMQGDAPVLVDSAGCGAAMKDYPHLLRTPEAVSFAGRVRDVHEWLAAEVDRLPAPAAGVSRPTVAIQDPCHLRHVQRAHLSVRTVLGRFADIVELDDDGMCCGAGGAYAAQQPELSSRIRERKLESIARAGAPIVASANPGCVMHLRAVGVDARHPLEIVDEVLRGRSDGR